MATAAKLEITLKINELPAGAVKVKNDWMQFSLDAEGTEVMMKVRPKVWNKLTAAQAELPQWVAAVTGRMGPKSGKGFELLDPAIQVFEKKAKEATPATDTAPE